jgi:hypothetical protein
MRGGLEAGCLLVGQNERHKMQMQVLADLHVRAQPEKVAGWNDDGGLGPALSEV